MATISACTSSGAELVKVPPRKPVDANGGEETPLSAEEEATRAALQQEYDRLETEHETLQELPEAVEQRLSELETLLASFDGRPAMFDPVEVGARRRLRQHRRGRHSPS